MSKPDAYILKTTGEEIEYRPANGTDYTLAELQHAVGGYVQLEYLPDGRMIIMNEEGNLLGLKQNAAATVLAYTLETGPNGIVGDVLICPPSYVQ